MTFRWWQFRKRMVYRLWVRCESCESEPMTELPLGIRRKTALWAFWRFHVAAHELDRELLRTLYRLLRWDRV